MGPQSREGSQPEGKARFPLRHNGVVVSNLPLLTVGKIISPL